MELPGKIFEVIAYNTRPKLEEHMFIVMGKSTQEDHISQPLQTNIKQFKLVVTFQSGYNGKLNARNKSTKINFISLFEGVEYNVKTIPP